MRLKRGARPEALYLSDIHYLVDYKVKSHAHNDLFAMLDHLAGRNIRFRRIYLVGDIIENWYFSSKSRLKRRKGYRRFRKLFDRIARVATKKADRYYVIGNHDSVSPLMTLPDNLSEYLTRYGYRICDKIERPDLVILHGHQGQYGPVFWAVAVAGLRLLHFVAAIFPGLFDRIEDFYKRNFNFDRHNTQEEQIAYYRKLSDLADQQDRWLISGHTHQFCALPELRVMNTGDWVDSRTLIVEDHESWSGLRWDSHTRHFTEEFRVHKPRHLL